MKVTPAHDPNDFAIGQRHNLPQHTIFDSTAHIDLPGSPYHGLDRFAARERIVADLAAEGLLVSVQDHAMSIPVSQRSGAIIEPRLSMQWFIAVTKTPASGGDSIAAKAIAAVRDNHIRFIPEMYAKTYFEWMNNIHDWCISRQLWWGHRIPAWHCDHRHITVSRETPTHCSTCGSANITQETDVLDTWFSSGLLPFTVFGWPEHTPNLDTFYPTQLLVTGFDILFFWVARMIMLSTHFMLDVPLPDGTPRTLAEAVPFQTVYIHALVRDADKQKMSKTKGNVIDPIEIITEYGTDAVRFTLASQASPGTDIAFNEARTEGYRAFANKIWNAARFLFGNVDRARAAGITISATDLSATFLPQAPLESRWITACLAATTAAVDKSLAEYRFDEAASAIYQFFWGDFCDWYIEIVKLRLNFDEAATLAAAEAALTTLLTIFEAALRLLSPFMPFITEEVWHAFWPQIGLAVPAKSIALTKYPVPVDFPLVDASAMADMHLLQELIVAIRGLRKEACVPEGEFAPIEINAKPRVLAFFNDRKDLLKRMARVADIAPHTAPVWNFPTRSTSEFDVAVAYERTLDIPAERERLTKEIAKYEKGLQAADRQLGNGAFMEKAPANIVEGLRKQAAETRMLFDKATAALTALPPA